MADYFNHWLSFGRRLKSPPRIFAVNWFRKDAQGRFIWPGFRENMRVLRWIVERVHGQVGAIESPIGWMPRYEDLDWRGLEHFTREQFDQLMAIDREEWKAELLAHDELFIGLYDRLPKELPAVRSLALSAIWRAPERWNLVAEND
jgi:phosphoenolpyruvate carboxykinase (GTP)